MCFDSCYTGSDKHIEVKKHGLDKIELVCPAGTTIKSEDNARKDRMELEYKDEKSGEYACGEKKIFVKFRSKFCEVPLSSCLSKLA